MLSIPSFLTTKKDNKLQEQSLEQLVETHFINPNCHAKKAQKCCLNIFKYAGIEKLEDITLQKVTEVCVEIHNSGRWSKATLANRFNMVLSFLEGLEERGLIAPQPGKKLLRKRLCSNSRRSPDLIYGLFVPSHFRELRDFDISKFLGEAPFLHYGAIGTKILLLTGIRAIELLGIESDHAFEYGENSGNYFLWIEKGKFGKERNVPISRGIFTLITEYEKLGEPKFITKRYRGGRKIFRCCYYSLYKGIKEVTEAVCCRVYSPHCLRYMFIRYLETEGLPVQEIQKIAGHASSGTTYSYVGSGVTYNSIKDKLPEPSRLPF